LRAWDKSGICPVHPLAGVASVGSFRVFFLLFLLLNPFSFSAFADCVCGGGDGLPLLYEPISLDGDMSDWAGVLADEDNCVCDGPSGGLIDLDAPVGSNGQDIVQFSFTYDDTRFYFYTERSATENNIQNFVYYADVDNDGFMKDGEPVIWAEWKGGNRNVDVFICQYDAVDNLNGDPMVDLSGFGDGYSLPGKLQNIPKNPDYSGTWGSADGKSLEFGIEWSRLGLSGPLGHALHVSSTNTNKNAANLGSQIQDNLGGCGGGGGSVQFAYLDFSGAYTFSGYWGENVWGLHHLVNLGNGYDSFAFVYDVSGSWSPTVSLFLDDGDGIYTVFDTPITSTVGLASGASADVLIVYGIESLLSGTATVATTAVSQFNPVVTDTVTDAIQVVRADIVVVKSISGVSDTRGFNSVNAKGIPGASVTYSILATNVGNAAAGTDSVFLTENIPTETELYVGTGAGSPVGWSSAGSGLTFSFGGLGDVADDVAFSSDSGPAPAFTYVPAGDAEGFDGAVRSLRINPKGRFDFSSSFTLSLTVRVR